MVETNSNPFDVKVGEVWVENDPRHPRKVKVVRFLTDKPYYDGFGYVELENVATGKRSVARLDRFNGRRSGYSRKA
jgi:hypothetical protein